MTSKVQQMIDALQSEAQAEFTQNFKDNKNFIATFGLQDVAEESGDKFTIVVDLPGFGLAPVAYWGGDLRNYTPHCPKCGEHQLVEGGKNALPTPKNVVRAALVYAEHVASCRGSSVYKLGKAIELIERGKDGAAMLKLAETIATALVEISDQRKLES